MTCWMLIPRAWAISLCSFWKQLSIEDSKAEKRMLHQKTKQVFPYPSMTELYVESLTNPQSVGGNILLPGKTSQVRLYNTKDRFPCVKPFVKKTFGILLKPKPLEDVNKVSHIRKASVGSQSNP